MWALAGNPNKQDLTRREGAINIINQKLKGGKPTKNEEYDKQLINFRPPLEDTYHTHSKKKKIPEHQRLAGVEEIPQTIY